MERPGAEQTLLEAVGLLVTAWRNLTAYPPGHPVRAAAIQTAHARLAEFMAASGRLVLGVARDALLYGERKLESVNVLAFAEALYRRNAALLYIEEDVQVGDLEVFLKILAEGREGGERLPIGEALRRAAVDRVAVSSIDYTQLVTTDHLAVREPRPPGSLWDTLIQALLTGKQLTSAGSAPLPGETYSAAGIAALLRGFSLPGPSLAGFGKSDDAEPAGAAPLGGLPAWRVGPSAAAVLAGALSDHLSRVKGRDKEVAVHQVAELLRALPAEVREPLLTSALKSLDAEEQTPDHLQGLTGAIAPDQVLKSLRRLNSEGVRLSPHALRLIQTLARARKDLEAPSRSVSVSADIAEMSALFQDEDVDRFNPDDHRALLEQVAAVDLMTIAARPTGPAPEVSDESLSEEAIEQSLVATLFDLVASHPDTALPLVIGRLRTLLMRSLDGTGFDNALAIVRGVRALAENQALTPAQRLGRASYVASLVEALSLSSLLASAGSPDNLTLSQIQELVTALGPAAARGLLAALTVETDRTRRFQLFDLAVSLGEAVVPEATRLLADHRWFVVRNMIVLLRKVGDRTSLAAIQRCAEDSDPRVGLEAIMTLLALDSDVSREMLAKIVHNPDPKLAEAAVVLTGQHGIVEAVDPLVAILLKWDPFGSRLSLRLKAFRALKTLSGFEEGRDPVLLARLERYFRHWRVPLVQLEERRAAFRLLETFPARARAPYVARGRRSRDAVIRAICDRLARASTAPAEGA
jgi:HEAT repeats